MVHGVNSMIVGVGEVLWDLLPGGPRPGGAPCNVAYHAAQLGNRGVIVGRVGRDTLGDDLLAFLAQSGVDISAVQRDTSRPTGTVEVALDGTEPRYTITEHVAWDFLAASVEARAVMRQADVVCVGSLAHRAPVTRSAIQTLLDQVGERARVIFDLNLRPPFIEAEAIRAVLARSDVVKASAAEVEQLAGLLGCRAPLDWLLGIGVEMVCVTRGRAGASLTSADGTVAVPGIETDPAAGDPVGAGDAFTAALADRLVRNVSAVEALAAANRYAALVASKHGAMPTISRAELRAAGW